MAPGAALLMTQGCRFWVLLCHLFTILVPSTSFSSALDPGSYQMQSPSSRCFQQACTGHLHSRLRAAPGPLSARRSPENLQGRDHSAFCGTLCPALWNPLSLPWDPLPSPLWDPLPPHVGPAVLPVVGPSVLPPVGPTVLPVGPTALSSVGPSALPPVGPSVLRNFTSTPPLGPGVSI